MIRWDEDFLLSKIGDNSMNIFNSWFSSDPKPTAAELNSFNDRKSIIKKNTSDRIEAWLESALTTNCNVRPDDKVINIKFCNKDGSVNKSYQINVNHFLYRVSTNNELTYVDAKVDDARKFALKKIFSENLKYYSSDDFPELISRVIDYIEKNNLLEKNTVVKVASWAALRDFLNDGNMDMVNNQYKKYW